MCGTLELNVSQFHGKFKTLQSRMENLGTGITSLPAHTAIYDWRDCTELEQMVATLRW
jgi:hypothetical protein